MMILLRPEDFVARTVLIAFLGIAFFAVFIGFLEIAFLDTLVGLGIFEKRIFIETIRIKR